MLTDKLKNTIIVLIGFAGTGIDVTRKSPSDSVDAILDEITNFVIID